MRRQPLSIQGPILRTEPPPSTRRPATRGREAIGAQTAKETCTALSACFPAQPAPGVGTRKPPNLESRAREQASVLSLLGASCKPCPARVTPGPLLLRKVLLQDHHERAPWCAASSCSLVTSRSPHPLGSPPLQAHPASTSRAVLPPRGNLNTNRQTEVRVQG